ncbi:DUF1684 domain-containing protein [Herbiconiux sp. L3-i23]|uniref:DUF1684 domain-containing protein n=1 Tax=Herbiconiux sp. L3-i23 TaxID=2905871 RepID=UPI002062285C|nr:DUF1684 domain-containing protein [Herbiconiux sp. L3-i23]BDI22945.1 hypothetical protein L3i23_17210 [Herbiconiux sp. L3-i23]
MTDVNAEAELDARLKARRIDSARGPLGALALVNTQWVDSEQPIWGVPGTWAPLPEGQSGLIVRATAADGVEVDGTLVDGVAIVAGPEAIAPSTVVFDDHTRGTVVRSESGGYGLRVWDSQSEGIARFGGIDSFPYDPAWVITGRFTPLAEGTTVAFEHVAGDDERLKPIPGEIGFDHDGGSYTVVAFPEGSRLQLVFADATNGDSTYSVGRFLFVAPDEHGEVVLDFNRAVLPPCAFSYNFNCPIPPAQNRFPFPVTAGEKNVLDASGGLLH